MTDYKEHQKDKQTLTPKTIMGCDIHWVLEEKTKAGWIGLMSSSTTNFPAGSRWYGFFTELGLQFRGESSSAVPLRGYPDDLSMLSEFLIAKGWADHSESWLPLKEFLAAYHRAEKKYEQMRSGEPMKIGEMFGGWFWPDEDAEYRVVFAFDN